MIQAIEKGVCSHFVHIRHFFPADAAHSVNGAPAILPVFLQVFRKGSRFSRIKGKARQSPRTYGGVA